mgnify:CR=1 FL=1
MTIDPATGDVLVAGWTDSDELPGTAGGAQPGPGGDRDGFVSRLLGNLKAVLPQQITFPAQAGRDFVAGARFAIDPPVTANSGLAVSYASSTPAMCTVTGSTVTMVSAGACTVVASQAGNATWAAAAEVAVDIVLAQVAGPGPSPKPAAPVPALSAWGLALLGLLAGSAGCGGLRRRRA